MEGMSDLFLVGVGIILVGFLVVFLATVTSGRSSEEREARTEVKGGGVVMIGPIPIIFGSDAKWATVAIVLAIALIVVALLSGALANR
jgi:uncharacterized protein (TIGR00304 family)